MYKTCLLRSHFVSLDGVYKFFKKSLFYSTVIFLVVLCLFIGRVAIAATEENFQYNQLLRMKDKYDPLEVINPFLVIEKKEVGGSLNVNGNKDIYSFYEDISSKNQSQINLRLQQSFGVPYSFFGKVNIYGKVNFDNLSIGQTLHIDMGGSFYLIDPVFPEIKTLLFQNQGASTEFIYHSPRNYKINTSLNYGRFKYLKRNLNIGDLTVSKPSFKLKEEPYKFYLSLDLSGEYNLFDIGNIILKINSISIVKQDFELFNSFAGFLTNDILPMDIELIDYIKVYAGYSPFYRGDYSVERTIVLGSKLAFNDWLNFDLFTTDDMYLGAQVKLGPDLFNASVYTYEASYDDYGIYKFRNYGFNLNINF